LGAMLFFAVHSSAGTFLIFFLSTVDTRNKVLYNNYLHDADDSDRCTATLLAELISVCDGLSDISFSDGSMFAYDDVCDLISYFALLYF